ncbi:MAG: Gp19/Gp15/Gp42 family protein [Actinomycetia bacterium]|nr:Gp19/Gp15/Gp42 family protein [Actinomycetes bacterium]
MPLSTVTLTAEQVRTAAYGLTIPEGDQVDEQLKHLVDKARRELSRRGRGDRIAACIAAGRITTEDVRDVLENAVVRVLRNPGSYRHVSIDDFQATLDQAVSSGALHFTDRELADLCIRPSSGFGTIRVSVPPWRLPR